MGVGWGEGRRGTGPGGRGESGARAQAGLAGGLRGGCGGSTAAGQGLCPHLCGRPPTGAPGDDQGTALCRPSAHGNHPAVGHAWQSRCTEAAGHQASAGNGPRATAGLWLQHVGAQTLLLPGPRGERRACCALEGTAGGRIMRAVGRSGAVPRGGAPPSPGLMPLGGRMARGQPGAVFVW